ncbi:cysteine proteinase inhibitor B-like [Juglans microcarpa x Juglans regia]|uniref:cysteine proteinase inhibitor B-like n=1 Tax=Juglans microcarpa x Juglans regia TaxID=2249226 RepID=UPI001B7F4CB6|nr:cysteine proteinase inhibitor B-like [Juglans microcarpa x Juglans regia]
MALIRSPAAKFVAFTIFFSVLFVSTYGSRGRLVGGRMKIRDVKTNEEVQDLGKFSVEEYNRSLRQGGYGGELTFVEVVEAQRQVVSGIKYYLVISATQKGGETNTFESAVVVKPWVNSKKLLNFGRPKSSTSE